MERKYQLHMSFVHSAIAILFGVTSLSIVNAQDLGSIAQQNMAFDQQFNQQLGGMMMQNQMAQRQLMQNYIQQNGPQLQQQYQQFVASTGMQISFEQFVYSHIMTAGGTNPGPALQQQQQNFRALQDANRTVQQGNADYNQGWQNNQQVTGNVLGRYDREAIQGNQIYRDPQTGETAELPYAAPQGTYQNNNGTYANDPSGNWHAVDPLGYGRQLEPADPDFGDDY